ncbi:MAG TPA: metallophosphoesterase family protein [Gaiellaceae bacterium]|jgi:diadenosine tetraphosphatase ApaH/serine/threonine PP2A family protein phosphatase
MRVAVVSDIHANLPALDAVLHAIDEEAPDGIWCLGDVVGYGPHPNECCAAVRERAELCLAGNHDLGVLGSLDLADFSPDAAASARWSAGVLAPEARAFLEPLPSLARRDEAQLYHASPRDPVWEYVLTEEGAADALALTDAPVVLVGHTHVPLAVTIEDGRVAGGLAPGGAEVELAGRRWLLNPGSVGQPRDEDPRAAWLLIDFAAGRAAFRRVPYPIERTQADIRAGGLPEVLATRLAEGR